MGGGDLSFAGIDTDDLAGTSMTEALTAVADGGDGGASSHLYHRQGGAALLVEKGIEAALLGVASVGKPGIVTEHQNVGPCYGITAAAAGNVAGPHGVEIDRDLLFVIPDLVRAGAGALQVVDGAVNFEHLLFGKSGFLKLSIDVGGDHEGFKTEAPGPVS